MTPDDLEEKVALAIECVDHPYSVEHIAKAAISVVIEEAAKVAEELIPPTIIGYHDTHANNIAAAIRALAQPQDGEG